MGDDAVQVPFQAWKRERDIIEQEMKLFLATGRRTSVEDRGARQAQFAALVERRNAATRNLLQWAFPIHRSTIEAARAQTATALQPSCSPPTAKEVTEQDKEPAALDRWIDAAFETSSEEAFNFDQGHRKMPPAHRAGRGTEPAALDSAPEAISEEIFNFDLAGGLRQALPSTRGTQSAPPDRPIDGPPTGPALAKGQPIEAQGYPRIAFRRVISARFLPLQRVQVRPAIQNGTPDQRLK